jgi:hypothetical protein
MIDLEDFKVKEDWNQGRKLWFLPARLVGRAQDILVGVNACVGLIRALTEIFVGLGRNF